MLGAVAIDNREDASETAARIDNQPRCLPERTEVQDSRHRKVERRHEQLLEQQQPGPGEGFGMCDARHHKQAGEEERAGWLRALLLAWLLMCAGA